MAFVDQHSAHSHCHFHALTADLLISESAVATDLLMYTVATYQLVPLKATPISHQLVFLFPIKNPMIVRNLLRMSRLISSN